jgi:hypothetical protein
MLMCGGKEKSHSEIVSLTKIVVPVKKKTPLTHNAKFTFTWPGVSSKDKYDPDVQE